MTFKQRVRAGERLLGGILRMPAELLVELSGVAGLDYVLIDCEHGPADLVALHQHILTAEAYGLTVLVRVGRGDANLVLRALDLGAAGIVVPHVDSARDARAAVAAAHYPPLGDRGFATYSRAGRFGDVSAAEHLRTARDTTVVIAMIETRTAVADAAEILAVEGIDGVLVGPADLSVSLGLTGGASEPAVIEATASVHRLAEEQGTAVMSIVGSVAQAASATGDIVVYNLAHVLLGTFRDLAGVADSQRESPS